MTKYAHKLIALLFPLCGVIVFIGGVFLRRRLADRVKDFKSATGVLVDNIKGSSGGLAGDMVFYPYVEYYVDDCRFTVVGSIGRGKRKNEGQTFTVLYSPLNPNDAVIKDGYYFPAEVAFMIGGAFIAVSIYGAYLISTE